MAFATLGVTTVVRGFQCIDARPGLPIRAVNQIRAVYDSGGVRAITVLIVISIAIAMLILFAILVIIVLLVIMV